jgi:hypothetical protein
MELKENDVCLWLCDHHFETRQEGHKRRKYMTTWVKKHFPENVKPRAIVFLFEHVFVQAQPCSSIFIYLIAVLNF